MSKVKTFIQDAVAQKVFPAAGAMLVNQKGDVLLNEYAGVTNAQAENPEQFDLDTSTALASCTKLITSIAALQLVEQGKIQLDDFVESYVPMIAKFQLLESAPKNGEKPVYRPAKAKPTVFQLMTHTSGLGYDFFDADTFACSIAEGREPGSYYSTGALKTFEAPYVVEPGTKYLYGTSTDFLGEAVQAVSGMQLIDYFREHILDPLGMKNTFTKFKANPDAKTLATHMHQGVLIALPEPPAVAPEYGGGGGYLLSSMNDFSKLLATLLNGGTDAKTGVQILKEETVRKYVLANCLSDEIDTSLVGKIDAAIPPIVNPGHLMDIPEDKRGVSCAGLLVNGVDLESGRKKGSAFWCGFMNVYYWIDPTEKIAGLVATNMLPFMYKPALELLDVLERTAYGK